MLCECFSYTEDDIRELLDNEEFEDLAGFQDATLIGTGCGRCLSIIQTMLSDKFPGEGNKSELSP
jgi:NAD(P)H-nitrite reductase large subunit